MSWGPEVVWRKSRLLRRRCCCRDSHLSHPLPLRILVLASPEGKGLGGIVGQVSTWWLYAQVLCYRKLETCLIWQNLVRGCSSLRYCFLDWDWELQRNVDWCQAFRSGTQFLPKSSLQEEIFSGELVCQSFVVSGERHSLGFMESVDKDWILLGKS